MASSSRWVLLSRGLWMLVVLHSCPFSRSLEDGDEEVLFKKFTKEYNRSYVPGSAEYTERFENFKASLRRHQHLNSHTYHLASAKYGINQFSDLSPKEFQAQFAGGFGDKHVGSTCGYGSICSTEDSLTEVPNTKDWRDNNPPVLPPVRNQASCGSCWAFTTVETIEAQWAIRRGQLYSLSPQQLISCDTTCAGCSGGSPSNGFDWLLKTGSKVMFNSEMPYKGGDTTCPKTMDTNSPVMISNFSCCEAVTPKHELDQLKVIVYQYGPVAVEINGGGLQDYIGGIIQHHCDMYSPSMHSVILVGYDTTGEIPYWIVQNSWGTSWGENGFFRAQMGKNMCGIGQRVAYPFV